LRTAAIPQDDDDDDDDNESRAFISIGKEAAAAHLECGALAGNKDLQSS
jgi:hypothetical protein